MEDDKDGAGTALVSQDENRLTSHFNQDGSAVNRDCRGAGRISQEPACSADPKI